MIYPSPCLAPLQPTCVSHEVHSIPDGIKVVGSHNLVKIVCTGESVGCAPSHSLVCKSRLKLLMVTFLLHHLF